MGFIENQSNHSIAYNVIMNIIVMTSAFIFPLITVPYLSRTLLEYGNGLVSFAQNFVYYFATIASMGVASYGVVACSRVREDRGAFSRTTIEILIVLMGASALMSVLYLAMVLALPRFGDARALYIFMVSSIWTTAFSLEWFYQAIEKYDYITIRALIVRTLGTICIFIFVKDANDYLLYAAITVATQAISCAINLGRLRRIVDFSSLRGLRPLRHVKPMLSYLIMSVGKGMANNADVTVLGFAGTVEMVGVYQIASKVKNMVVAAVDSVGSVLLPRLTSYKTSGNDGYYSNLLTHGVNFALLMGCYALFGLVLCSRPIVDILGGELYMGAVAPLIATSPAVLFASGTSVLSQTLLVNDGERRFALANLVGLIVSVISSICLVPLLGIVGSGVSASLSQLAILSLTVFFSRHELAPVLASSDWHKVLLVAFAAFAVGSVLSSCFTASGSVVQLVAIGSIYSLSFGAGLLVSKESLFMAILSRFRR